MRTPPSAKSQSGFSALLAVVIIGAASLIMLRSSSLLSIGELNMGYSFSQGRQTAYLAESCAEEALRRLQLDENFTASGLELPVGANSCIININSSSNERTVTGEGRLGANRKQIEASVLMEAGSMAVTSWVNKNF